MNNTLSDKTGLSIRCKYSNETVKLWCKYIRLTQERSKNIIYGQLESLGESRWRMYQYKSAYKSNKTSAEKYAA